MFDPETFENTLGERVDPEDLKSTLAIAVARLLRSNRYGLANLLRAYRDNHGWESLVFNVEVERPQRPAAPIARRETLVARFLDDVQPQVFALRSGFPTDALHLNLGSENEPPWLCLDDRSWEEARARWTAHTFVERIRWWLAATARGDLHGEAQPAEPVFLSGLTIILPPEVLRGDWPESKALDVHAVSDTTYPNTVVMREGSPQQAAGGFFPMMLRAEPQKMQRLRMAPSNIKALHELLATWGLDLIGVLRGELKRMLAETPALVSARPLLLLYMPLLRGDGSSTGQADVKAFSIAAEHNMASLGAELGIFHVTQPGQAVLRIPADLSQSGDTVKVDVLAVQANFDRATAAAGSGLAADERSVALVGGGAIGSHLMEILRRDGFGHWTVIDRDALLPHNLQRHIASAALVGKPKAVAVAAAVNGVIGASGETLAVVANVLSGKAETEDTLSKSALIVDASASIPVARFLSDHGGANAPRLSVFFNTAGRDVALIGEDARRDIKLDALEAQYYRAVLDRPTLADHIAAPGGSYRYATSCRSVSFRMPEYQVSMLTGAIAGEVRRHLETGTATIAILSGSEEGLHRTTIPVSPAMRHDRGGWEIVIDDGILTVAAALRAEALPSETGGILLGTVDVPRRQICVVKLVAAPADSFGDRAGFERGTRNLSAVVADAHKRTAGQVEYVGEWHSHPQGAEPSPSETDISQLVWLGTERMVEDLPAIMMIIGDDGRHTINIVIAEHTLADAVKSPRPTE